MICPTAGATYDLTTHCSAGSGVKYYIGGNLVTSVTCPDPEAPVVVDVVVASSVSVCGCMHSVTQVAGSGEALQAWLGIGAALWDQLLCWHP